MPQNHKSLLQLATLDCATVIGKKFEIGRRLQSWGWMQFSMSFSKDSMAQCTWIQLLLCIQFTWRKFSYRLHCNFQSQVNADYYTFRLTIPLSWQSLDDIAKFMTTCCPNEGLAMAVATRTKRFHRIIHHSLQKWFQNKHKFYLILCFNFLEIVW